jgi:prepilin-type processing-associated H-X9-DG protein
VTLVQALYKHMKNVDIAYCPDDSADHRDPNSRPSYWWKVAIDKAWYGVDCSKPCRNQRDFPHQADQIVFYEHNSWHFGPANGLINNARINVAYLDSHVRNVVLSNATHGDPINCAANSSGEPMYFNFDNKGPRQPGVNPPRAEKAARYVDPGRYSDVLD